MTDCTDGPDAYGDFGDDDDAEPLTVGALGVEMTKWAHMIMKHGELQRQNAALRRRIARLEAEVEVGPNIITTSHGD